MEQTLFTTPRGSSSSIGDSDELPDANASLTLSHRLRAFKSSTFDPNAYVGSKSRSMNEKIRHVCAFLVDLKKASAKEMHKSVLANYSAFMRTSKEISDLEGELLSMRNLLSTQAALVHGLAEGCQLGSLISGKEDSDMDYILDENTDLSKTEKWLIGYLEMLEVLLAEKRVDEAMAALDEGERMTEEISEQRTLSPSLFQALLDAITEHRQKLAGQLAETICQASTRTAEIRSTALALKKLGDGPRAHTLLLNAHHEKLQRNRQSLQSTSYGGVGAFTATLSQLVFSNIHKQHQILCYYYLLEANGLTLSPVLLKYFRPFVEEALNTNLKRIEQPSAALAAADDWLLAFAPTGRNSGLPPLSSFSNLSSFSQSFQAALTNSTQWFRSFSKM